MILRGNLSFDQGVNAKIARSKKKRGAFGHSEWVISLFLSGTILDYGGGFYVKHAVFSIAVIYLLTQRRAYTIWLHCLADLAIVILIPTIITMGHLILSPGAADFENILEQLWGRIGSPSYFIFVPLIYFVGAERTANWFVVILTTLAMVTILLILAHVIGMINIFEYTEFMVRHRLALFGTDTRAADLGISSVGLPSFGASQAFPVGFSLALASHPVSAVILAAAIILQIQRGQVLGLIFSLVLMLAQMRRMILVGLGKIPKVSRRAMKIIVLLVLLILAMGVTITFYMGDIISVLMHKYRLIISLQDESTLVRLGHIEGYWLYVKEAPLGLLWGFGPNAYFFNTVTGYPVFMTEMVILIYIFWYGWLYTTIFYAWIGFGLCSLLKHSRKPFDSALVTALVVLLIIGNINPVMFTPMSFFFLALVRARRFELAIS